MSVLSAVGDIKVLSSISTFVKTKHANSNKMPFSLFFNNIISTKCVSSKFIQIEYEH